MSPSMFVQSVLHERLQGRKRTFSQAFEALAGSWEDDRSVDEIIHDLQESRRCAFSSALR